jgi:hypothetical protein
LKSGKVPQQVIVLCIALAGILTLFFGARALFVPKTFGQYGHYRAAAIDTVKALPIAYAGVKACAECHEDIVQKKLLGFHRNVACEVCHGAAIAHTEDPSGVHPEAPRLRGLCPLCHNYNPSRPTGFPQIITAQHNPGKPCMSCHNPHNPVPPVVPKDCAACHRGIANQKAVSAHASVECKTCHEVPAEHFKNPRLVLAAKPTNNGFCGKCHDSKLKDSAGVPKVEIEKHSGRYLCWDCHYPHFPEAKQ